jgi:hypothetical protein
MCKDGINVEQLTANIEQINEAAALCRRWAHRNAHQVEDAGMVQTSAKLHAAQSLLDDVRSLLEEAKELIEKEAGEEATVTLV